MTKSNIAAQAGTRFVGVPRNVALLWADYDFGALGLEGFSLGGGIRYVSRLPGDLVGGLPAPAYTLFDAVASYTTAPWRLFVNVRNLTSHQHIRVLTREPCGDRICWRADDDFDAIFLGSRKHPNT